MRVNSIASSVTDEARSVRRGAAFLTFVLIAGCADIPAQGVPPSREPTTGAVASSAPPPEMLRTTQVFVYPGKGQTAEQLDRDRYECYLWAVEQTGFDPSLAALAPHQRVEIVPMPPPGADVAAGAVTGAVVGAIVSGPRHTGEGVVAGAVIGGLLGGAAEAARAERATEIQRRYDESERARLALLERQSSEYRRAITACLEGRGYTVK